MKVMLPKKTEKIRGAWLCAASSHSLCELAAHLQYIQTLTHTYESNIAVALKYIKQRWADNDIYIYIYKRAP